MNYKIELYLLIVCSPLSILCLNNPLAQKNILQKGLELFAQSSFVEMINQSLARLEDKNNHNHTELKQASQDIQALGHEAQLAVGIPPEKIVPIKMQSIKYGPYAYATYNAIVINNSDKSPAEPFGVQRCNLYHEAVHIKYNDMVTKTLLGFITGGVVASLGILAGLNKILSRPRCGISKPSLDRRNCINLFCSITAISLSCGTLIAEYGRRNYYTRYTERRADLEGHYATDCYACVQEKVDNMHEALTIAQDMVEQVPKQVSSKQLSYAQKKEIEYNLTSARNHIKNKKNYLSMKENEQIIADLKQNNKICSYHSRIT